MDFMTALKLLRDGHRIIHETITNGQNEELVIESDCVFIKTPRRANSDAQNFIFTNPTIEQMLGNGWQEAKQ